MTPTTTFEEFGARLREFIQRAAPEPFSGRRIAPAILDEQFNELALALFALQFAHVAPYRQFCQARGLAPGQVRAWADIPAVPTAAFKEFELTSLPPAERTAVFHSSGTTGQRPSRHFHNAESLALYEASLVPWFRRHLLRHFPTLRCPGPACFVILTPPPTLTPHSSLVHMFETLRRRFGGRESAYVGTLNEGAWSVDVDAAREALSASRLRDQPVVVLGTAFAFVHLLDALAAEECRIWLPRGSRALETGGYKGRARTVPKAHLHALIADRLTIDEPYIVTEYGMSELSSQAYDYVAGSGDVQGAERTAQSSNHLFRFPPWARAQVCSPESGREVAEGETGLLRVFDLANLRSVLAIQTEDLAVRRGKGFELLGRAPNAEPRGCSLRATP
ncbi:MAG: long-chain fatty acid--CoA ligase [Verrucomicrobia bacterium]|nr:long-chain fatty acid--CoA ligase [Verrucomicrobiota bacterium]